MPIHPYLNFDGNTRQAVDYYARVFGAEKARVMTFGEQPPDPDYPMPDNVKDRVMHTYLNVAGTEIMFSDTFPGQPFTMGNNVSLTVVTQNRADLERWYNALAAEGEVSMPLQETFWSKAYAALRDKFGVEWQFSLDSGETF